MKKQIVSIVFLIILLLSACTNDVTGIEKIKYSQPNNEIVFTEKSTIKEISDIMKSAEKSNEIVDVGVPDEKLYYYFDTDKVEIFDLYLDYNTNKGFIVNEEDSNFVLKLSEQSIKDLGDILSAKD